MNCKNCGAVIKDGAKFCASCGQTVHEAAAVPVGGYSQPAYGGYAPPQPGYGAYPGTPQPGVSQRGYGAYPQSAYGYYGTQQRRTGSASTSAIKVCLLLFMAASLILSAVGLLSLPFCRQGAKMISSSAVTNGNVLSEFLAVLDKADGDFGRAFEYLFDDNDTVLLSICFIASLVVLLIAVIFFICGTLSIVLKKYSGAASVMGVGMVITAVGFLINSIEGIYMVSAADSDYIKMSFAPLIMLVVCVGLSILAFVSSGQLRRKD